MWTSCLLFDGGWISFDDDGSVLVSSDSVLEVLKCWHLDDDMNVGSFNEAQKEYLRFHRKHRFKGRS